MKEQLYTIPLIDAFKAEDECPFCYINRILEQHAIDFVLGSGASYMESDIREETDKQGFCSKHIKMMYEYGNRHGCGLIMSTHIKKKNAELKEEIKKFKPTKISVLSRLKKNSSDSSNSLLQWIRAQESSCYVCDYYTHTYKRYLATFFELYKNNPEFVDMLKNCKGFCLPHLGDLIESSETMLPDKFKDEFYNILFPLMTSNFDRVQKDIEWFCDKFDYRNKNADWKNSKDALQRSMQKMNTGYPADPPYVQDK